MPERMKGTRGGNVEGGDGIISHEGRCEKEEKRKDPENMRRKMTCGYWILAMKDDGEEKEEG